MKKFIFLAAIAATVVASCAKDSLSNEEKAEVKGGMIPYKAAVRFDATATKSTIDDKKIVWEVGEKVAIFDDYETEPHEFTVTGVNESGAWIEGEISDMAEKIYGVYPYSAAVGITLASEAGDSLTVKLPSVQTIEAGKVIASDALVTVSDEADPYGGYLIFYNPFSVLKFTVPVDGVKKVVFSGLDGKGVTGNQTIRADDSGNREIVVKGESSLTVSKADGFEKGTEYYATVFSRDVAGVRFVFTTDDYKANVESAKEAAFVPNCGLTFNFTETQIETDKFPINIYNKEDLDAFAAHSALYDAGEWVNLCADIDYDGEWTSVAGFVGNFNGGNYSIYGSTNGLTFKANSAYPEYIGFFSKIYGEVKDLKLGYNPETGEADGHSVLNYVETIEYAGPLAGTAAPLSGVGPVKITNVQNYVKHHAAYTSATGNNLYAGNLVGYVSCDDAQITSCANYVVFGNISDLDNCVEEQYVGGMAGMVEAGYVTFTECENYGNLNSTTKTDTSPATLYCTGGMVGRTDVDRSSVEAGTITINNCKNYGTVDVTYSKSLSTSVAGIGGIIGCNLAAAATVSNCENYGAITETGSTVDGAGAGGLIGYQTEITQTCAGCKVDCTVTSVNEGGMIVGNNVGTATYGTEGSKIKVRGTFNGTPLEEDNYSVYLYAGAGTATCNAEYWSK